MKKKQGSAEYKLLTRLFFRLLPYQILLIVISAVNGIVDSLYTSNSIGQSAMSAIGLFGPFNHFLYAASIVFVSGSQILYGRYLAKDRDKIGGLIAANLLVSGGLALAASRLMEPGEAGRNVGIRLVYRIASKVSYQNLLGMNVLTIRI